eukprot:2702099-Alexandrium_andersonii.AAC.1
MPAGHKGILACLCQCAGSLLELLPPARSCTWRQASAALRNTNACDIEFRASRKTLREQCALLITRPATNELGGQAALPCRLKV